MNDTDTAGVGDGMSATYPSLDAYNADVIAAREAYNADMAVQAGICAVCKVRPKNGHMRRCCSCRYRKQASA